MHSNEFNLPGLLLQVSFSVYRLISPHNSQQRVTKFVAILRVLFLVCKLLIRSVKIDTYDLSILSLESTPCVR